MSVNLLAMSATPMVSWATTVRPSAVRKSAPAPRARTIRASPATPPEGETPLPAGRVGASASPSPPPRRTSPRAARAWPVEENKGVVYPSNLRCALQERADPGGGRHGVLAVCYGAPCRSVRRDRAAHGRGDEAHAGRLHLVPAGDSRVEFLSLEVKPVVRVRCGDWRRRGGSHVDGQSGYPGGRAPEWRAEEAARLAGSPSRQSALTTTTSPRSAPRRRPRLGRPERRMWSSTARASCRPSRAGWRGRWRSSA